MILYTDTRDQSIGDCPTQPCHEKNVLVLGKPEEILIYFLSHKINRWPEVEKEVYVMI